MRIRPKVNRGYEEVMVGMIAADGPAPYAPASAVMSVILRHRQVALTHFDVATLTRIGVSESLAPRTLQALRLLGLVAEDGEPTADFENLRKSPQADFKATLAAILKAAYSPVFAVVDPSTATAEQVEDAFRHFTPSGQRGRMVTLFLGLLDEAGLVMSEAKRETSPKRVQAKSVRRSGPTAPDLSSGTDRSVLTAPSHLDEGDSYRVQLESGGSVSIVMDVNLFQLSSADRAFVIDLVDRIKGYESPDGS